jgi:hypothetical protein
VALLFDQQRAFDLEEKCMDGPVQEKQAKVPNIQDRTVRNRGSVRQPRPIEAPGDPSSALRASENKAKVSAISDS